MRVAGALLLLLPCVLSAGDEAAGNFSGRWNFSVQLAGGGQERPVIWLKQEGSVLTGRYRGPLGVLDLSGKVEPEGWLKPASAGLTNLRRFAFYVDYGSNRNGGRALYEGAARPDGTLEGVVEFTGDVKRRGIWTAKRDRSALPKDSHAVR